ncbi:heme A synthase [Agarivorans sp. 1_MG-2023]|uniref:COX15/CtaA family protein n=1 Tax=Agarivorans sp. 1_MG-2023 TaxID=3062634 RepID=UPI0026E2B678|nr:COX15/CtaA family protein [Agarivorans sp. 1_MG-2023]MDO6765701.1 COX15/CtaA family protein [Agarivorans sp. 1_MG-2023]
MQKGLIAAMLLAVVVIGLGAFTRLTDAGLGCPDWPGCYGQLAVPQTEEHIQHAATAFPERPLEAQKAWNEMIHRYFAGSLGLLVVALAGVAVSRKQHRFIAIASVVLIIFQAALGMLTVTLGLMPIVVMGHLLGGFSMLALLFTWFMLRQRPITKPQRSGRWLWVGLLVLSIQIALGGWTSANYSAISCQGLPLCHEAWSDDYQIDAFHPLPERTGSNYEFGVLSHEQRKTVHVTHRIWAGVTALYLFILALSYIQRRHSDIERGRASRLIFVLFTQVGLGVANVLWQVPLAVAVAHNLIAAMLLLCLISLILAHYQSATKLKPLVQKETHYGEVEHA